MATLQGDNNKETVIVYRPENRNLAALRDACFALGFEVIVCDELSRLGRCLKDDNPVVIVVPLSSSECGTNEALDFTRAISDLLHPEDVDLLIVLSSTFGTPHDWRQPPDPHSVLRARGSRNALETVYTDHNWSQCIERIKEHKETYRRPHTTGRVVEINPEPQILGKNAPPFPTEARFLLRAAFQEMSSISVGKARYGFSGAMAFRVKSSDVANEFFAKIYPDENDARKEYENYKTNVESRVGRHHRPHYNEDRRLRGVGYSLVVMDLVSESNGEIVTLLDMIQSESYDLASAESIVSELLRVLRESWGGTIQDDSVDLVEKYVGFLGTEHERRDRKRASKADRAKVLQSENSCNKWFGNILDDADLRTRLSSGISKELLTGSKSKLSHGDLHLDNVLIDGKAGIHRIPVLIDFSKTERGHFLKDLVTLECDIIMRGPDGIPEVSKPQTVLNWIASLDNLMSEGEIAVIPPLEERASAQLAKLGAIVRLLREEAFREYKATLEEYRVGALLKMLNFLSHGNLAYDYTVRAAEYVRYLTQRLRVS